MKYIRLFAGLLAASLLLSGCSDTASKTETKGTATDTSAAYTALRREVDNWNNADRISLSISGSMLSEYNKTPSAVAFSGIHQEQPGAGDAAVYSLLSYSYGDGYYYDCYYLSDGSRYVTAMETSTSATSEETAEEPVYYSEELDAETFASLISYGSTLLPFDESQVKSTTVETNSETGSMTYHFTLEPKKCSAEAIALLEQIQYIDTSLAEITCEVSSMSCDALFSGDSLLSLSYRLCCDLTCEGEVMNTTYQFTHGLNAIGEDASFNMPDLDLILNGME